MQSPLWEQDQSNGDGCFNVSLPCSQGNIPPVGIVVSGAGDIAAGLAFAQKYNIRVVVKSTGHEFQVCVQGVCVCPTNHSVGVPWQAVGFGVLFSSRGNTSGVWFCAGKI